MYMTQTIWMPVPGFEDLYEVSDQGEVRSLRWGSPRMLKPFPVKQYGDRQYLRVNLARDGKFTMKKVHHLVCETFHGPRPEGKEVRHLDDDPFNNTAKNLRWGTRSENMADRKINQASI